MASASNHQQAVIIAVADHHVPTWGACDPEPSPQPTLRRMQPAAYLLDADITDVARAEAGEAVSPWESALLSGDMEDRDAHGARLCDEQPRPIGAMACYRERAWPTEGRRLA